MTDLDDYLRANREAFTREALTKRLVDAGHDPAQVEAAWTRIEGAEPAAGPGAAGPTSGPAAAGPTSGPAAAEPTSGPIGSWTASDEPVAAPAGRAGPGTVLLAIATFAVYGLAILAAGATVFFGGAVTVLMIVYVIAMLFGLVYCLRLLLSAPTRAPGWGPIWAVVGLTIVIFIGLSGACFVALGPAMNASGGL